MFKRTIAAAGIVAISFTQAARAQDVAAATSPPKTFLGTAWEDFSKDLQEKMHDKMPELITPENLASGKELFEKLATKSSTGEMMFHVQNVEEGKDCKLKIQKADGVFVVLDIAGSDNRRVVYSGLKTFEPRFNPAEGLCI